MTKNPQKVTIYKKPVVKYATVFTCPSCHIEFQGYTIEDYVLRFKCPGCFQELIVDSSTIVTLNL